MSKVFVIHPPTVWSPRAQKRVPKYDLSEAQQFGELVTVYEGPAAWGDATVVAQQVYAALDGFDPKEDYLLPVGDPAIIAMASAAVATGLPDGATIRLLKWSRDLNGYEVCSFFAA